MNTNVSDEALSFFENLSDIIAPLCEYLLQLIPVEQEICQKACELLPLCCQRFMSRREIVDNYEHDFRAAGKE